MALLKAILGGIALLILGIFIAILTVIAVAIFFLTAWWLPLVAIFVLLGIVIIIFYQEEKEKYNAKRY